MTSPLSASAVVFGCVADNTPKYLSRALRLVQSLRWFGGDLADAVFIVCVVDSVDPATRDLFERHGATVRVVRRFHHANPHPNKLRLLELPEVDAFGTTVLLDCDTIVVRDVSPLLTPGVLQARMAGFPTVSTPTFRKLFARFGMTMPPEDFRCSVSGARTIWYCNDGVLVLPSDLRRTFFPVWKTFVQDLCDDSGLLNRVQDFCTQASLTLAYFRHPIPFSELPLEANCPIPDARDARNDAVQTCDPAIVHYHHRVDGAGFVLANSNPLAGRRIAEFNERLRRETGGTGR
jgi:hypothetical protein